MNPTQPHTPSHVQDLGLLAAGHETGWWDEHGRPAPWPEDFWLADGTIHPDWHDTSPNPQEEPAPTNRPTDQTF